MCHEPQAVHISNLHIKVRNLGQRHSGRTLGHLPSKRTDRIEEGDRAPPIEHRRMGVNVKGW